MRLKYWRFCRVDTRVGMNDGPYLGEVQKETQSYFQHFLKDCHLNFQYYSSKLCKLPMEKIIRVLFFLHYQKHIDS